MSDYTTVRIKKSSLEKINRTKGDKGSVADVIEKLLNGVEGCNIEDIVEVKRNPVAIVLEYTVFDEGNDFHTQIYNITFEELKRSNVGDKFYANPNPTDGRYLNDIAEVLFVDERSVLVRITETNDDGIYSNTHVEHIDLF